MRDTMTYGSIPPFSGGRRRRPTTSTLSFAANVFCVQILGGFCYFGFKARGGIILGLRDWAWDERGCLHPKAHVKQIKAYWAHYYVLGHWVRSVVCEQAHDQLENSKFETSWVET